MAYLYASFTKKQLTSEHASLLGVQWNSTENLSGNKNNGCYKLPYSKNFGGIIRYCVKTAKLIGNPGATQVVISTALYTL